MKWSGSRALNLVESVVETIRYKDGARFFVREVPAGIEVRFVMKQPDVDKPGEEALGMINCVLSRDACESHDAVVSTIWSMITNYEVHEASEWFRVEYKRPFLKCHGVPQCQCDECNEKARPIPLRFRWDEIPENPYLPETYRRRGNS